MKCPEISVLMPVYNAELYVREAVDSILNQTFTDFEFIIIDDCSTDGSYEVLKSITDDRIKLYRNDKNLNKSETRNKGLRLAKGKYLALMDADDINKPQRLKVQYDFLESHPEIDMCGTHVRYFGHKELIWKTPVNTNSVKDYSLHGMPFSNPTLMARKRVYKTMHYQKEFDGVEDYKLISDLLQEYKGYNIPHVLLDYRVHGNQASFTFNSSGVVEQRKSQQDLHYTVFKINLRRIYPKTSITDEIKLMEDYFVAKKIIPQKDYKRFGRYYDFLIKSNTKKVYSHKVLKMLYRQRIIASFIFIFTKEGAFSFIKSILHFYRNSPRNKLLVAKYILIAIYLKLMNRK